MSTRNTASAARRGFTAVELIAAITASLVVAAAAYMLARTSLTVFQQEARMNSAQFSNIMGMNRIATDAKRAGYQSSPDAATDTTSMCGAPPAPLAQLLAAVRVSDEPPGAGADTVPGGAGQPYPAFPAEVVSVDNKRKPDRVRFSGNYTTSERFKLANVVGNQLAVECDQLSVQRVFNGAATGGPDFCTLFPNGSIARVVDPAGKAQFVTVTACTPTSNTDSYTSLVLTVSGLGAGGCVTSPSQGYVNPVNIVDYFLTNLEASTADNVALGLPVSINTSGYGVENPALAGITGEQSRMSLVRRVLDSTGLPLAGSGEVVADYVADLKFSARTATPNAAGLTQITFAQDLNAAPANRLRTLGIRLTTRARNPDRVAGPVAGNEDVPLTLFAVFPPATVAQFKYARVRTMFMEVNLPNLGAYLPW